MTSETMAETIGRKNRLVFGPFRFTETMPETISKNRTQPHENTSEKLKRFLKRWSVDEGGSLDPSYSVETFRSFSRGPH